jgi:hypothetical protein
MAETTLDSLSAVIRALGGPTAVARLTRTKLSAVSNWQKFGRFPAKTYVVMTAALQRRRKSAPAALWGMTEAAE